jgi:hypothetical protein
VLKKKQTLEAAQKMTRFSTTGQRQSTTTTIQRLCLATTQDTSRSVVVVAKMYACICNDERRGQRQKRRQRERKCLSSDGGGRKAEMRQYLSACVAVKQMLDKRPRRLLHKRISESLANESQEIDDAGVRTSSSFVAALRFSAQNTSVLATMMHQSYTSSYKADDLRNCFDSTTLAKLLFKKTHSIHLKHLTKVMLCGEGSSVLLSTFHENRIHFKLRQRKISFKLEQTKQQNYTVRIETRCDACGAGAVAPATRTMNRNGTQITLRSRGNRAYVVALNRPTSESLSNTKQTDLTYASGHQTTPGDRCDERGNDERMRVHVRKAK